MGKEAKIGIGLFIIFFSLIVVLSFYPLINSMQILPSLNVSINNINTNYSVTLGGGTPFVITINEDTQYIFNFTINNSADGGPENLTDINLTVPNDFAFPSGSNKSTLNSTGKDTSYNQVYFSNLTIANQYHELSWNGTNLTSSVNMNAGNGSCCNVSGGVYLAVNFSVATPGKYNITITYQFNNSAKSNNTNITIRVNDSTRPDTVQVWNDTSYSPNFNRSGENVSGTITFNISVADNGNITGLNNQRDITHVFINITNSSGSQNATVVLSNVTKKTWNEIFWNGTFDTRKLPDGQYNFTIWTNDSYDNLNNSKIITNVTVDNTPPTGTVSCTPTKVNAGDVITCTCSPTDGTGAVSGINASATSVTTNPSTTNTGTFTETCSFKDMAGNSATASGSYTVEQGGSKGSSGAGGGGSSSSSFYLKTVPTIGDLKETKSITQMLGTKERVKISINSETHYVGVREIKTNIVVVEIQSNPIQVELKIEESKKIDLDNDGTYDVYIKLNNILNGKADLTIEYSTEKVLPVVEEEKTKESEEVPIVTGEKLKEKDFTKLLLVIVLVVVLVLLLAWLIWKKRN